MRVNAHLSFGGDCEEAFRCYADTLGGTIVAMMRWADSPLADRVPAAWREKILHATLALDGGTLTGADVQPHEYAAPRGMHVLLSLADVARAERAFAALADRGAIHMPLQQTFWAERFGMLVDRFGTPWIFNCSTA